MIDVHGPVPRSPRGWFVDLSQHNSLRPADWAYLEANGCSAVMLRACDGTKLDSAFHDHAGWAIRHHMAVGAYLFLRPTNVRAQVDTLLGAVRALPMPIWHIAVDVEDGKGRPRWTTDDLPGSRTRQAVWSIYRATGARPWVYTYLAFWRQWLAGERMLEPYPLWAARYNRNLTPEQLEQQFGRPVVAWQYGGGPVDGKEGSPVIDKNVVLR